jgi:pilus biogenesis lipoprotein CpaD
MNMNRNIVITACLFGAIALTGCGKQSTPSMVNTTRPQLAPETMIQQVLVEDLNAAYIDHMSENYKRFGTSVIDLSLGYDETSKTYTAMNAFNDLSKVKAQLAKRGVKNVKAEAVKINKGEKPVLWINYDAVTAQAPEGCTTMPGLDNNTTRDIGAYKFGCSIDSMLAKQIYRPADLEGNGYMDPASGRKAQSSLEHYHTVTEQESSGQLEQYGRGDIQN